MTRKIKNATVKTGEYINREGRKQGRYENVGSLMQSDDGSQFLVLKRTFNPAGVPNPDNKDSIIISLFEPFKEQDERPAAVNRYSAQKQSIYRPLEDDVYGDEVPF